MTAELRINAEQWDSVVEDTDGYQLVVAGPGTGKTELLVRRVKHIVESGLAARDEILVLTFSRRAARKLGSRVESILGGSTVPIETTTFHSLALRLLDVNSEGQAPTPLTTPEQVALVGRLLASDPHENWPLNYRTVLGSHGFAEEVADFLMRCSERLLSPADLLQRSKTRSDWRGLPPLYERYLQHLDELNRIDYGTLLVAAVSILESPDGQSLAGQYRYVLVDEFQDTSPAQAKLAELLAAPHQNLTVTGDPYQSIYSFRGAELRNIKEFEEAHSNVKRIVLEQSFRVPEPIMAAALRVVSSGELPGAAGRVLPSNAPGRVETYIFDQETAEAEWIANQVERSIVVDGTAPGEVAILVRSKQEMLNEMSRALSRRGISHDRPDRRLIDHPAIQAVADLVTLAVNDADRKDQASNHLTGTLADRAAKRILLGPLFGISLGQHRSLLTARNVSGTWKSALFGADEFKDLWSLLSEPGWTTRTPASEGFWDLWTSVAAFAAMVHDPDREEWRRAFTSFAQVLDSQASRDPSMSLHEFFELSEDESFEATPLLTYRANESAVVLTTLHQAKGLQFKDVFIANAVEGVFPDLRRSRRMLRPELLSPERTTDPSAVSRFQVQEEMRLAYTSMTRASRRVVWTATDAGVDQGEQRPSRFLLAASGKTSLDEIGKPREEKTEPISLAEAEIHLRRTAANPTEDGAERTSAVAVLASSPLSAWDPRYFPGVRPPGPDSPILGETITMSPSQAEGYSRCPRKYAIERRLRLGQTTSVYMQSGNLIHAALEAAESNVVGTDSVHAEAEETIESLHNTWSAAEFGTPALNRAWLRKAERIVQSLYDRWPTTSAPAVALEKPVSLEIEGITWYGIIDRLEQDELGYHIVDYKTGTTVPNVGEAETSIQLGFYAMAVNALEGPNVISAELWFPAKDSKGLTIRKLDVGRLDEVEQEMIAITRAISSEDWEPKVSTACDRCEFKTSCPAWPEGRGAFLP